MHPIYTLIYIMHNVPYSTLMQFTSELWFVIYGVLRKETPCPITINIHIIMFI